MKMIKQGRLVASLMALVSLFAIQTVAEAGGDSMYRTAQKTSLYTCPGQIFEMFYEHGNVSVAGAGLGLVCSVGFQKARWVILSAAECDLMKIGNGLCKGNQKFPLEADVVRFATSQGIEKGKTIENRYYLPKAVLGEFCEIIDEGVSYQGNSEPDYRWRCQKYSYLAVTKLSTMGTAAMLPRSSFYHPQFDPNYTFSSFAGSVAWDYKTWIR
jgi:hypothetical protein